MRGLGLRVQGGWWGLRTESFGSSGSATDGSTRL